MLLREGDDVVHHDLDDGDQLLGLHIWGQLAHIHFGCLIRQHVEMRFTDYVRGQQIQRLAGLFGQEASEQRDFHVITSLAEIASQGIAMEQCLRGQCPSVSTRPTTHAADQGSRSSRWGATRQRNALTAATPSNPYSYQKCKSSLNPSPQQSSRS